MAQPLQLLIAEDNTNDAELLLRELRRAGFDPTWKRVDTEAEFVAALHINIELVLSDFDMPQFTGLRALQIIQQRRPEVPLIIVSGTIGEETAVEAMRLGAMDYLLKDRLVRLGPAVKQALEQGRLRRENRQTEQKLREQLAELLRWQEVMIDREERVHVLKAEVNDQLIRQNLPPRYPGIRPSP
jgi:DNA-binding NtrC family response regulator